MLCPSCNNFRPANNAPCPWCSASAAQSSHAWEGQNASFGTNEEQGSFSNVWGGPAGSMNEWGTPPLDQLSFPTASWENPPVPDVPQLAFNDMGMPPMAGDPAYWGQTSDGVGSQDGGSSGPRSLVPYQPQPDPASQTLALLSGMHMQSAQMLAPALPDQEQVVYVPPMYTKPRPLIPRSRAISGLLSVVIVGMLLCAGAGYFAQVTGKLTPLEKLLGLYNPPTMASTIHNELPVPSIQQTPGPANKIIYSIGLGSNRQIPTYVNQFTVNQTVYMSCGVSTTKAGTILVKWYTNGSLYRTSSLPVPANYQGTGQFTQQFGAPAEGRADIYWNNQLAGSVLFVIEPIA